MRHNNCIYVEIWRLYVSTVTAVVNKPKIDKERVFCHPQVCLPSIPDKVADVLFLSARQGWPIKGSVVRPISPSLTVHGRTGLDFPRAFPLPPCSTNDVTSFVVAAVSCPILEMAAAPAHGS